ncbi:uncharacterized protein LOC130563611 [Triplophysa rosa]|uniref:uncharacterized protein LOC130563611 n=1 Tax=Triplophysa rosa TaxID=992332 RepID=UPI0025460805|nr:uncharacterized protein LOC130563611 [Triplophysa rosa]
MRVYLTALTIALGCIYWRVSGKLVEVVVRPGDNAILLCDREIVGGQDTRWVKICSSQIQPPLIVSAQQTLLLPISRFSVLWDNISKSFDLMIENITDADLGLYYCSTVEKQIIEHDRLSFEKEVYHTGDTLTKLTYASSDDNECSGSSETHHDSVSECWQCWLILLTVCPACSLFSASLAFLCGKSCYHKKVFKKSRGLPNTSEMQSQEQIQEQDNIEEVCYTSLNIPKQRSKLKRNNPMPNADNSVYNDIKIP